MPEPSSFDLFIPSANESTWRSLSAQIAGHSHRKKGIPCQDATCSEHSSGVHCIALADGAGSASRSDEGAIAIVKETCRVLAESFDQIIQMEAIDAKEFLDSVVKSVLTKLSESRQANRGDFASTLLAVAVKDEEFVAAHLGDGIIVCVDSDNHATIMSDQEKGEHANETFFTTSEGFTRHLRIYRGKLEKIAGFLLASDGSAESLYRKSDGVVAVACSTMLRWMIDEDEEDIRLALEDALGTVIADKANGDDCSIALLRKVAVTTSIRKLIPPLPEPVPPKPVPAEADTYADAELTCWCAAESSAIEEPPTDSTTAAIDRAESEKVSIPQAANAEKPSEEAVSPMPEDTQLKPELPSEMPLGSPHPRFAAILASLEWVEKLLSTYARVLALIWRQVR